jgi:O-antigen/teichoic acid export membrane protein
MSGAPWRGDGGPLAGTGASGLGPLLLPAANLAVRAAGLGMRFLLVLYLARDLGLDALGRFGLIQGAASVAPVAFGWGVTYFLGREIVGQPPAQASRLLRDRLALTVASLLAAAALGAMLVQGGLLSPPAAPALVAAIVLMEAVAFDAHVALIGMGRPLAANLLLLLRGGAWVLPVAGLGLMAPALRSLEVVLAGWAIALALNMIALWPVLRVQAPDAVARRPVDLGWIAARIRGGWLIYLNDLALVGMAYLDRYILDHVAGLPATGVFVLHWSIANALHVLVSAAIVQVSLPNLVLARRKGGMADWRRALWRMATRVVATALGLALALHAAAMLILPALLGAAAPVDGRLLALMLAAMIVRLAADALNYGLYSLGRDRTLAQINLGGALTSALLGLALISARGLEGAALAMLATATLLLVLRATALRRTLARPDAAP